MIDGNKPKHKLNNKHNKFNKFNTINQKPKSMKLNFMVSNVRGYNSKRESVSNIVISKDIHVLIMTETHCRASTYPRDSNLANFQTFFRNRKLRSMGGLAVMINRDILDDVVKVEEGDDENEYFVLLCNNTVPATALCVMYGTQTTSFGRNKVEHHISEMFGSLVKYVDRGCNVVFTGDTNISLGDEDLPGNSNKCDRLGKKFRQWLSDTGLVMRNKMCTSGDTTTFVDPVSGSRSTLDIVASNVKISDLSIDHDRVNTPYSITKKKGKWVRCLADHDTIFFTMEADVLRNCPKPRVKMWRHFVPDGREKFFLRTEELAGPILEKVQDGNSDILEVVDDIEKAIIQAKDDSYGRISMTQAKFGRMRDENIWKGRIKQLERLCEMVDDTCEKTRVYTAYKIIKDQFSDEQIVKLTKEDGSTVENVLDIYDYIIEYNVATMGKEDVPEEITELQNERDDYIDEMFMSYDWKQGELEWEIYLKAVEKIAAQKKPVFFDFLNCASSFKVAIYLMLNRLFKEEVIPREFHVTLLTKLYKGKGNQDLLSNSRFIHGKRFLSKLYEKCLVMKIDSELRSATPRFQIGGQRKRSTREHLLQLMILMQHFHDKGEGMAISLVDVTKCFDKAHLNDVVFRTLEANCDIKTTKTLFDLSDKTLIKIRKDPLERETEVNNTCGQGTVYAPLGCALAVAKEIEEGVVKNDNLEKCDYQGTVIEPACFIDDVSDISTSAEMAKLRGEQIGKALERVALKINPKKTVVIVTGSGKNARTMRSSLAYDNVVMQDKEIKVVASDKYLGLDISEKGVSDSVKMTITSRINKAWQKVKGVKTIVSHPLVNNYGWLKASTMLYQAIFPATVLYSCEVWPTLSDTMVGEIDKGLKGMLYSILDIPINTKYNAVLKELNLMLAKHMIAQRQINYFSQVAWEMTDTAVHQMVWDEWKVKGDQSYLARIDRLCEVYKLPKVTETWIAPDVIKDRIKVVNILELTQSCLESSATRTHWNPKDIVREMWMLPKAQVRAALLYRTGAMKFRGNWKISKIPTSSRFNTNLCPVDGCGQLDTWGHANNSDHYLEPWDMSNRADHEIVDRILTINQLRMLFFKLPII